MVLDCKHVWGEISNYITEMSILPCWPAWKNIWPTVAIAQRSWTQLAIFFT